MTNSELANAMWSMGINEEITAPGNIWNITRVPGGWIYAMNEDNGPAVFVPKDNEFIHGPSID